MAKRPLDSEFQTKPHFVDQTVALCQRNGFEELMTIFENTLGDKNPSTITIGEAYNILELYANSTTKTLAFPGKRIR